MNDIVRERIREITPSENVDEMSISELENSCKIAFEIIGYFPKNLSKAVARASDSNVHELSDFIYEVWRLDI